MIFFMWAVIAFFFSLVSVAQAEDRSLTGPMIELRYVLKSTDHTAAGSNLQNTASASVLQSQSAVGIKLGWRFLLGERVTVGPMLGLYRGGTEFALSREYLPEAVQGRLRYRQDLSATAGLQVGVNLGRGWLGYGEVGVVGERVRLDATFSRGAASVSFSDTGYFFGRYGEIGVAKRLGENFYLNAAYHERFFSIGGQATGVIGSASKETKSFLVGVGWQF